MRALEGDRAVVRGWPDMLVATDKGHLVRAVGLAHKRGELAAVGPVTLADHGVWYCQVIRLKPARKPPTRWPWIVGGVIATLAAAAAGGWYLATAYAFILPGSVALSVLWTAGRWLTRDRGCTITHVRH